MITISEKDGATIIVIEQPSGTEKRLIEQAKRAQKILSDEVWGKFACNQKVVQTSESVDRLDNNGFVEVSEDFYNNPPF